MAPSGTTPRMFHKCAYCSLIRLCSFYGRRWLCDDCAYAVYGGPA